MEKDYIDLSVQNATRRQRMRLFHPHNTEVIDPGFSISDSSRYARVLRRRRFFSLIMIFFSVFAPTFLYFSYSGISSSITYASESAAASESLVIPALNLSAPVMVVQKQGSSLVSPDQIAGVYHSADNKAFIMGHSSTIFKDLKNVTMNDEIIYNDSLYRVTAIETLEKSAISMTNLLRSESVPTIVLMTCAGTSLGGQDYSHRLIITAVQKSVSTSTSTTWEPAISKTKTKTSDIYSESISSPGISVAVNEANLGPTMPSNPNPTSDLADLNPQALSAVPNLANPKALALHATRVADLDSLSSNPDSSSSAPLYSGYNSQNSSTIPSFPDPNPRTAFLTSRSSINV